MSFLKIIPLIFIIISALILYSKLNEGRHNNFDNLFGNNPSADIFKIFGVGFWLTLLGAIVMAFHKDQKA